MASEDDSTVTEMTKVEMKQNTYYLYQSAGLENCHPKVLK